MRRVVRSPVLWILAGCFVMVGVAVISVTAPRRRLPSGMPTLATSATELVHMTAVTGYAAPPNARMIAAHSSHAWDGTQSKDWLLHMPAGEGSLEALASGLPVSVEGRTWMGSGYAELGAAVLEGHLEIWSIGEPIRAWSPSGWDVSPAGVASVSAIETDDGIVVKVSWLWLN